MIVERLATGVERGEIEAAAAETQADLLFDLLAGTLVHRMLVRGQDIDDTFVDTLVHAVLVSVGVDGAGGSASEEVEPRQRHALDRVHREALAVEVHACPARIDDDGRRRPVRDHRREPDVAAAADGHAATAGREHVGPRRRPRRRW